MRPTAESALERHGSSLKAWLRRLLADEADCEDAYAAVTERVVSGIDAFRGDQDSTLRSWLFTIARNEGYRMLRRRGRARVRERRLDTADASRLDAGGPGLSTQLRQAEMAAKVRLGVAALLDELSSEDAALLVLRFQEERPHRMIAAELSTPDHEVSEAAVRKRVSRLTARLRARAKETGLDELVGP